MYSIYRQLHPTTGIEHCIYCNFIDIEEKNLVIASINQLHVYRLNQEADSVGSNAVSFV